MKISLITKENCPKCEYVKNLFKEGITLDLPYDLEIISYKLISLKYLEDNKLYNAPIIEVFKDNGEQMIIKEGMTKENITKRINDFVRKS